MQPGSPGPPSGQARRVAHNLRRALRRRPDGVLRRLLTDLDSTLLLTDRLLAQTALRVRGQRRIPERVISLADPDARTIRRGKARHPNRFGYKVLAAESSEGFIVHHQTERGNPPDHDLILPAVEEVAALTGRVPETVVADRGFGPAHVEESLLERGVKRVGIPRGGRPGEARRAFQHGRPFRRMARWRIGIEARISHLKHGFGLKRTRLRTLDGATTWVGLGIWAYNLNRLTVTG